MKNLLYDLYDESKGRGNKETEIFYFSRNERSITIKDGEILDIKQDESSQLALRIIKDGRIGFCTSSGKCDINEMVNDAIEISRVGERATFSFANKKKETDVKTFSQQIYNTNISDICSMAHGYAIELSQLSKKIHYEFRLTVLSDWIKLISSDDNEKEYKKSILSLNFDGKLDDKEKQIMLNFRENSCKFIDISNVIEVNIKNKIDKHISYEGLNGSGKYDVILSSDAVYSIFRNTLAMALNGKRAASGILVKKKYDNRLSVYDDGICDWKIGSQPFDDEGTPSRRTPLILEGKTVSFIYDKMTGAICGVNSTGNGKRAWGIPPSPVSNNLIISGKDTDTYDNIIHNIKKGILIDYVINDGRSQPINGIFSGYILRGYYIENGKLIAKIKNKKIYISIYEAFNNIICFANDAKWVAGEMFTPSIWFKNIDIF